VHKDSMIYGYARVSTDGQSVDAQVRQLTKAGCKKVFRETASAGPWSISGCGRMTLYPSLTRLHQDGPMHSLPFDATITLGDHHLAAAGLDPQQRPVTTVDVVRNAVQRMDGASWIDV
jgi:hypothetical protein